VLRLKKEYIYIPLLPLWAFVACSRVNFSFTPKYKTNYKAHKLSRMGRVSRKLLPNVGGMGSSQWSG
jgi:hypothetical protein